MTARTRYDEAASRRWLTWLAREMQDRGVTVFLIEDLQPSCLGGWKPYALYVLVSRLLVTAASIAPAAAAAWALDWSWREFLPVTTVAGVLLAAQVVLAAGDARWPAMTRTGRITRAAIFALLFAAAVFAYGWLDDSSAADVAIVALIWGLVGAAMGAGKPRRPADDIHVIERLSWSWRRGWLGIVTGVALVVWAVVATWEERGGKFDFSDIVIAAAFLVAILLALPGFRPGLPGLAASPNQGIRNTASQAVRAGVGAMLVVAVPFVVLDHDTTGVTWLDPFPRTSREEFLVPVALIASLVMVLMGGKDVIRHASLRALLAIRGVLPWRLARFLDYAATDLQLLQKVGGGYIFVHRMLLEHFAGHRGSERGVLRSAMTATLVALLCTGLDAGLPAAPAAPPPLRTTALPDVTRLAAGDLVFRSGRGLDSRWIRFADRSPFSHVGLIELGDGVAYVIHVEPGAGDAGRVRREPLASFLGAARSDGFAVYRLGAAGDARAAAAVAAARGFQAAGVTFDPRLDLDTASAMYCSELVWRAYLAAGVDLTHGHVDGPFPLGPRRAVRLSRLMASTELAPVVDGRPARGWRSSRSSALAGGDLQRRGIIGGSGVSR